MVPNQFQVDSTDMKSCLRVIRKLVTGRYPITVEDYILFVILSQGVKCLWFTKFPTMLLLALLKTIS